MDREQVKEEAIERMLLTHGWDIDGIVADLVEKFDLTGDKPTQTVDGLKHEEFWDVVFEHNTRCKNAWCILDPHEGDEHVDATGHSWEEEGAVIARVYGTGGDE